MIRTLITVVRTLNPIPLRTLIAVIRTLIDIIRTRIAIIRTLIAVLITGSLQRCPATAIRVAAKQRLRAAREYPVSTQKRPERTPQYR